MAAAQSKGQSGTANQPGVVLPRAFEYAAIRQSRAARGSKTVGQIKVSLQFVLGDYRCRGLLEFVQHCRTSTKAAIHDHRRPPTGWYQMVSGPVAAFWKQSVAANETPLIRLAFAKGEPTYLLTLINIKGQATMGKGVGVEPGTRIITSGRLCNTICGGVSTAALLTSSLEEFLGHRHVRTAETASAGVRRMLTKPLAVQSALDRASNR